MPVLNDKFNTNVESYTNGIFNGQLEAWDQLIFNKTVQYIFF